MYCKYCGQEIDEDSTFCKYCGKRIEKLNNTEKNIKITSTEPATSNAETSSATKNDAPINITNKRQNNSSIIANEIVANLKMIGLVICVLGIYYLGFSIFHNKDIKPLNENSYYGESCYDPKSISGNWEFSWERHYYLEMTTVKPYSQWSQIDQKIGIPPHVPLSGSTLALSMNLKPEDALRIADEMANNKEIPTTIIEKIKNNAKSNAQEDREDFNSSITSIRIAGHKKDLEHKMTICTIISLVFFIGGRYLIKFRKWVIKNKTN